VDRGTELEEELCPTRGKGEKPELIDDEEAVLQQLREHFGQAMFGLRLDQICGEAGSGKEANLMALVRRSNAQGGCDMGFPEAGVPHQDNGFCAAEIGTLREFEDLCSIELRDGVPVEIGEGFQDGKAGMLEAAALSYHLAATHFLVGQGLEVAVITQIRARRIVRESFVVLDKGWEFQVA
jgi:hypothetical protein